MNPKYRFTRDFDICQIIPHSKSDLLLLHILRKTYFFVSYFLFKNTLLNTSDIPSVRTPLFDFKRFYIPPKYKYSKKVYRNA